MCEGLGQRCFVTQHFRQIVRQRSFNRQPVCRAEAMARDLDRFFHRLAHVNWFKHELRRMRKVVDLGDDLIKPVDLADNDFVEIFSKIGVVKSLGKKLREGFNRNQRIANFVRHAGGQVCPKGGAIEEHTSELQSLAYLVCRLLLEKKKKKKRQLNE